jgi:hypothetical protein
MQISIPTPCHENWDAMTASTNGRFCGSCQKEVVDFSAKTDAEILAFFEKYESPCIRIETHRLDKPLAPLYTYPLPRTPYRWYRPLITAALIATMSVTNVYAQAGIPILSNSCEKTNPNIWTGKVVNYKGQGIRATIHYQYKGEKEVIIKTDKNGNWKWDKTGIEIHHNWSVIVRSAASGIDIFPIEKDKNYYIFNITPNMTPPKTEEPPYFTGVSISKPLPSK